MKDGRARLDVRIRPEIAHLLHEEAARQHRSLNGQITLILERFFEALEAERRGAGRKREPGALVAEGMPRRKG